LAAGSTYTPIATTTLGSATSSYTFSSIPSTYTDLVLIINGQCASGGSLNTWVTLNSDTGTNYSSTTLYGDGTSAVSSRNANQTKGGFCALSSAVNSTVIYQFQNYSNSTTYKTFIGRGNVSADIVDARVSLWRSTSAINTIKIELTSGINFNSGTTFTLYGITAA